jgi:hypothetical protein
MYQRNTKPITINGKDYQVLDPLCIGSRDATHALISGDQIVECKFIINGNGGGLFKVAESEVYFRNMNLLGIRPLKFLPKEPVTFEGQVPRVDGGNCYVDMIAVDCAGAKPGMRFRCVEILEDEYTTTTRLSDRLGCFVPDSGDGV